MATLNYKPPKYDDKKYRDKIINSDAYKYYGQAVNAYKTQQEANRRTQLGDARSQQQTALKNAYVTRLQNQQRMNQNLATAGIRGGMTETTGLRLAGQYSNEVANANSTYASNVNAINQNIDANINQYQSDMESRAQEYAQNQANAMWQADREDSLNKWNSANEFWNNYYLDYYSGSTKKQLKKALKEAKKNLKNAKGATAQIRYRQQIRGIRNRLGVIRNK